LADFLQQRQISNDGSQHGPRILVTSDVNLDQASEESRLYDDLYHRLAPFTIHVPALRRRKDEIPVLLGYMMNKLARRYDLPPRKFSEQTITNCVNHSWPGNLRELKDFVKRYLITGNDELNPTGRDFVSHPVPNNVQSIKAAIPSVQIEREKLGAGSAMSLKALLENVKSQTERNAIAMALQKTGWNRKAAARLLSVSYRSLLYKIERYHMRSSDPEFAFSSLKTADVEKEPEIIRNRNAV
jgi:two-component system, NtrC family, response regulator AtoC